MQITINLFHIIKVERLREENDLIRLHLTLAEKGSYRLSGTREQQEEIFRQLRKNKIKFKTQ